MIIEKRQFWFTRSSLINALRWYAAAPTRRPFPPGEVVDIRIDLEPALTLVAIMNAPDGTPGEEVAFAEPEIMAILIYFCKSQKIPVPRHSEKKIVVAQGMLIFQMARKSQSHPPRADRGEDEPG